jgi:hypothetical protein
MRGMGKGGGVEFLMMTLIFQYRKETVPSLQRNASLYILLVLIFSTVGSVALLSILLLQNYETGISLFVPSAFTAILATYLPTLSVFLLCVISFVYERGGRRFLETIPTSVVYPDP